VVDPAQQTRRDQIFFGATVTYARASDDAEVTITIVGVDEAEAEAGRISWVAPVARALLGARVGDLRRLRTPCPECGSPGWGLLDTTPGLPCSVCRTPTELTLSELWGCQQCGARREKPRRDGLLGADPGQCPWCNP